MSGSYLVTMSLLVGTLSENYFRTLQLELPDPLTNYLEKLVPNLVGE
jgi:hypothetical protein